MFGNIDVVRYTQMSRLIKVGEEYAKRLLLPKHGEEHASGIASRLVERYPEHGFIIDSDEAPRIGLRLRVPTADQLRIMEELAAHLGSLTAIGRVFERPVP